ncbi:hypothetical protein RRG08_028713 [Elysia crispata]|uniref:Uncharacterized protein n=1 Tax=Elysia crispata TaxID=231223 RepID=A0AAE0XNE1_9GAST|nr:hypothetical protein RRG08_028713 [Elysia crispata]
MRETNHRPGRFYSPKNSRRAVGFTRVEEADSRLVDRLVVEPPGTECSIYWTWLLNHWWLSNHWWLPNRRPEKSGAKPAYHWFPFCYDNE